MSRAYATYTETSIFSLFKSYISGPIYLMLGNHDTSPSNIDSPHSLPGPLGTQLSWNYNHVSALWSLAGWLTPAGAEQARTHYGAYSILHPLGLRIITLNTDFWYRNNPLNFISTPNPDVSGILSFLITELQRAEDNNERVWILGHVLSGWDGSNALPNPTDLFYQIVERYSPHVIAGVFFGHSHEDLFSIFYSNNGTVRSEKEALMTAWVGPSITPLTNLNSGWRMYEVDTGSWEVMDAYTFTSDVDNYADLEGGPLWEFEYSTREVYGGGIGWGKEDPLNATFWHRVTEGMERDRRLVEVFNGLQGKGSGRSPNCTTGRWFLTCGRGRC